MINFWPLLHPLTNGGGTVTQHLACCLLSMWQWSSITHPTSCPPTPTNMEIGWWLPLDWEGSREALWIEAYTCCLQRVVEASSGWSWVTEGKGMAPQVSPLVEAFLSTTGRCVSPSILWAVLATETWYCTKATNGRSPGSYIPLLGSSSHARSPSNITWDIFAWPDSNKNYWKEDYLPYSPGSTVDLGPRILGIQLVLRDRAGNYQGVAWVLKFEGCMLVYDPQTNGAGWVAMRGVPSLLTEVESRSTNDLGKLYPIPSTEPAGPKANQSPPGKPTVEYKWAETQSPESTVGDLDKYIEWHTDDAQDRSCTPSPTAITDKPTQGETVEETLPMRQNRCLVLEWDIESDGVPSCEHTPVVEKKRLTGNEYPHGQGANQPCGRGQNCRIIHGDGGALKPPLSLKWEFGKQRQW